MENGQKTMKIRMRLFIISGIFLVITCAAIVALVNYSMKQQALVEAEAKIKVMADQYFAIHTYFSQKLKPALFEFTKPIRSDDYFDPTWMSSTYAIREIVKYIRLAGGNEYYLRDTAVNARSPENEANLLEKDFISALNTDPKLKIRSSVELIDGKPYLVLQRRGELMEASCLRCHNSPEQAPGDLVRYYGAERSFHRKIGDWVSAISIKVPLSSTYTNANRFSLKLSGLLSTTLLIFCVILYWLNNRLVFKPLSLLHEKALEISNSKELLGEEIPLPSGRELKELTSAFNKMSISLRYHMDHLEKLVKVRTDDLLKTNEQLKLEIEERRQAEEALKESEEKYRNILENIDDGYFEVDIAGNFIFFNDSMCRILGYSKDELMGMNNREYMDEKNAKKIYQTFSKTYRTGISTKALDWKLIRKDGSGCFVETLVSLITDSKGKGIGFRGIARDISDRKQLEAQFRQAQKMESIGTLAGGISHDFNNILSSIIGFTELALDDVEKGTPLEENLQEVFTAGIRAKDLIGQILTLSRHSAIEFKPILINSVVKETVKMLRSTIPTSINFQGNICDRQLVVHADPTQIQQVIINLATNAKHAMSETGGVLMIDVDPVSFDESTENINLIPGNYARITVSDTGSGVNKDHLEKIFEPYFTTKGTGEGSGLGLSVVHGIVKSHKGDIAVYSEPGKGTKFHIYLPLSEQQSIELPATTAEPIFRGTERILIVDDEPSIVKMQQRSLERLGYSVTTRTSSVNALETFCATPDKYDLVITDMTMPDMTGDKLADEIKKIRPGVPVILCTGFSDNIKIRTGPDLQIDEFISKPINQKKLAKIIRKLLDKAEN